MAYTTNNNNTQESVIVKHGAAATTSSAGSSNTTKSATSATTNGINISLVEPVSRTYQYRKVMKPMLERKRRARINRCLDELKELMVTALQSEGENVSKLEKADILELTVRHLHKLRRQQRLISNPVIESDRFRAGFTHAANEVSRCLAATPGVDIHLGTKLMTHLGHRLNDLDKVQPLTVHIGIGQSQQQQQPQQSAQQLQQQPQQTTAAITPTSSIHGNGQTMYSPPSSPSICSESHYAMPLTPVSSRSCHSQTPSPRPMDWTTTTTTATTQINTSQQQHHQGLLKVVAALQKQQQQQQQQQHHITKIDCSQESVWRPW